MIGALDRAAFGGDRLELLRLVASASDCWLYTAGDDADPDGYLLVRALEPPRGGVRLGPWVAKTPKVGAALLATALRPDAPWQAGIAGDNEPQVSFATSAASTEALSLFQAIGGTLELDDVVMRLDLHGDTPDGTGRGQRGFSSYRRPSRAGSIPGSPPWPSRGNAIFHATSFGDVSSRRPRD